MNKRTILVSTSSKIVIVSMFALVLAFSESCLADYLPVRRLSSGIRRSSVVVFSGKETFIGHKLSFSPPFSSEAPFAGVEASSIFPSSRQRVAYRRYDPYPYPHPHPRNSRLFLQCPTKKSTPASRGAHIYALTVVCRCMPGCRRRRTARGRSRSPKRWMPGRSTGRPSRPVRPSVRLACGRR